MGALGLVGSLFGMGGSVMGLTKTSKKVTGFGGTHKRRRRRSRLTAGDLNELSMLKSTLGKTAAANALPFYLGRR